VIAIGRPKIDIRVSTFRKYFTDFISIATFNVIHKCFFIDLDDNNSDTGHKV